MIDIEAIIDVCGPIMERRRGVLYDFCLHVAEHWRKVGHLPNVVENEYDACLALADASCETTAVLNAISIALRNPRQTPMGMMLPPGIGTLIACCAAIKFDFDDKAVAAWSIKVGLVK